MTTTEDPAIALLDGEIIACRARIERLVAARAFLAGSVGGLGTKPPRKKRESPYPSADPPNQAAPAKRGKRKAPDALSAERVGKIAEAAKKSKQRAPKKEYPVRFAACANPACGKDLSESNARRFPSQQRRCCSARCGRIASLKTAAKEEK